VIHVRNLTERVLATMFPPIPENCIRFRHIVLFGQPESGKTTMLRNLAEVAVHTYNGQADEYQAFRYIFGTDNRVVNIKAGYRLGDLLTHIDDRPVQLLIVDDAARCAHARRGMSDEIVEDIKDFYEIRHIFERKRSNGIVIVIWSVQRFKSIDVTFRNGHVLLFKTAAIDPQDAAEIKNFVHDFGYGFLTKITEEIYENINDNAKSITAVRISWDEKRGIGYMRTTMPMHDYLDWIEPASGNESEGDANVVADYYAIGEDFEWEEETYRQLKIRTKGIEKKWVDLWYMHDVEGKNPHQFMSEYEERVGYKQAWVYVNLRKLSQSKRFMGMVAEIRGKLFEEYLKEKLEARFGKENVEYHEGNPGKSDFLLANAGIEGDRLVKGSMTIAINAKIGLPNTPYPVYKFQPELEALREGTAQGACIIFYDITTKVMRLKWIDPASSDPINFPSILLTQGV